MDFESVLQPIPEYIRWVTEKGELHYLTLEKTTYLIRENCEIASSNDLFWPWRIFDTFFNIDPEPLEEMLKQLSILRGFQWKVPTSTSTHANGNLRSPSVRTWRGKPGENICCINCVAELNKKCKANNGTSRSFYYPTEHVHGDRWEFHGGVKSNSPGKWSKVGNEKF